jgi:hypothetical protein
MKTSTLSSTTTLWLLTGYFFACGASAVFYPTLWLLSAGLPTTVTPELELVFGVAGVYLLALAYGAWRAARSPSTEGGIIAVLLAANILDCVVTLRAVMTGALPTVNGLLFVAVTVVWIVALKKCDRTHP